YQPGRAQARAVGPARKISDRYDAATVEIGPQMRHQVRSDGEAAGSIVRQGRFEVRHRPHLGLAAGDAGGEEETLVRSRQAAYLPERRPAGSPVVTRVIDEGGQRTDLGQGRELAPARTSPSGEIGDVAEIPSHPFVLETTGGCFAQPGHEAH